VSSSYQIQHLSGLDIFRYSGTANCTPAAAWQSLKILPETALKIAVVEKSDVNKISLKPIFS